MQRRAVSTRSRQRLRLILLAGLALTALIFFFRGQRQPPPQIPLPGTYTYFHEIDFYSKTHQFGAVRHCDPRFAPQNALGMEETRRVLRALLETYMKTMGELGVQSWVAHGTLLGWYWNKKMLPWDTDIDVQMSVGSIAALAKSYNMTEYPHTTSGSDTPTTYLLDINPHYTIASDRDFANKIDGRWIDTTNGKYIDITAVHSEPGDNGHIGPVVLFCKDGHRYKESAIYPLQESTLEGFKVYTPSDSAEVLREEYGKKALTNSKFHWHHFNRETGLWEPD